MAVGGSLGASSEQLNTLQSTKKRDYTPQEAASLGLGWVPASHSAYGTAGYVGSEPQTPQAPAPPGGATPQTPAGQGPGATGPVNQPGAGNTALQTPGGTGVPGTPGATPTVQSVFRDALLREIQSPTTPSLTDPNLQPQVTAFRNAQQRSSDRQRQQLAGRMGAEGAVDSGAFETQLAGQEQARGQAEAGFEAGLLGQERAQRLEQLGQYMNMAGNLISDEERQQLSAYIASEENKLRRDLAANNEGLQRELANLDAELRKMGIGSSERVAMQDLFLRQRLGEGNLQLGLLGTLLGNRQAYDQLGAQIGMFNAQQDQQGLLGLLPFLTGGY